nr:MAG TPA: N-acetylmuramoyl-L-alanine amidase [Caudoviricetes sp.]
MSNINPNWAVTDVHPSPNYDPGRPLGVPTGIVLHWWGLPEWNQTHDSVVNFLSDGDRANPTSAHYVASEGRVTQLVSDNDRAWHCYGNNMRTIGIECHPAATEGDLRTIARLIAAIRSEWGNLPLSRHSDHFATACPGNYSDKLDYLDYLSTHLEESENEMQLTDTITRPDGHSGSVAAMIGYMDMRLEKLETLFLSPHYKRATDGSVSTDQTDAGLEIEWAGANFARVYDRLDTLAKRVDDLVNLIEVGASK